MFKKLTKALSKGDIMVRHGARQTKQGKKGPAVDVFAMRGRDTKALKRKT